MESDPRDCLIMITTMVPQIFSMPLFSTFRQQKILSRISGALLGKERFSQANHVEHLFQNLAIFLSLSYFICKVEKIMPAFLGCDDTYVGWQRGPCTVPKHGTVHCGC